MLLSPPELLPGLLLVLLLLLPTSSGGLLPSPLPPWRSQGQAQIGPGGAVSVGLLLEVAVAESGGLGE